MQKHRLNFTHTAFHPEWQRRNYR